MTIRQYYRACVERLGNILGLDEAESAARIIFEDTCGYSRTFIFANGDREITDFSQSKIAQVIDNIAAGLPVQYAVGKARFMGNDYAVNESVLIPRPETAGLVDIIIDQWESRPDLHVLDIGTGSGCIAVSLARALHFAKVEAIDISSAALEVARLNAKNLGAKVDFHQADILSVSAQAEDYDIIVSNPPYICESERTDMDARVLDHEPATALFVPDSDPLLFYKAIADYAAKALKPGGALYFEINQNFGIETKKMLADKGFEDIDLRRDYKGNYRFTIARKPL